MLPIVLRHEAKADVLEAADWYDQRSWGLGYRWFQAVESTLSRLRDTPDGPAPLFGNVRRWTVDGFPFGIFYRIREDQIEVLAVLHGRRHARILKSRLKNLEP